MIRTSNRFHGTSFGVERKVELLRALNAAAAMLQRSAHSEFEVYQAVKEQIAGLGLRGALSMLDGTGDRLVFRAVSFPGSALAKMEKLTGLKAEGFSLDVARVDTYRQVIESGQTIFVPDNTETIAQLLPESVRPLIRLIHRLFGKIPGIFAPLMAEGRVWGVLNVTGAGLTAEDVPAMAAFANHTSIALDNARLFAAVQQAEAKYRRLFESASDGILVIDPATGRILSANPKAVVMTGLPQAELLTIRVHDLHPPDVVAEARRQFEAICERGQNVYEMPIVRRNGSAGVVQISATTFDIDGRPMVQWLMRDITAHQRAERIRGAAYRISEAALTASDLETLFRSIHHIISELMPANNFYIALYDETTDMLSFPYFVDEYDEWSPPKKPEKGLTEYVLRTGKPLLASPDVFRGLVQRGEAALVGVDSIDWLGVPLKTGEQTIGVLAVQTYTEGVRYSDEDKAILTFVSAQTALAIGRKRAEEALRESVNKYRMLVEQAADVISITDPQGDYIEVNSKACELLGYTREELLQMNMADLIPPEDLAAQPIHFAELRAGQTVLTERRLRHKDGSLVLVETSARMLEDGRIQAIVRDITGRKRVEAALRESEERLRLAVSAAQLDTWEWDILTDRTSSGGYRLMAPPAGTYESFMAWVYPADREVIEQAVQRTVENGEPYDVEFRTVRPDGSIRWQASQGQTLRDESGRAVRLIGVTQDITERKQAQEALRQAQKMESLGVLAGGIAHDFNNLLVAMLGQASLALAQLPPESAARAHVGKVVKAAERAADLTRQMLAYSGRGQFEKRSLNLNALIQENLHLFEVAVLKNVQLRSLPAEPLPTIEGDVGQLQQVIMNLIINAAEAIGERLGTVRVTTGVQEVSAEDDQLWRYTGEPLAPGEYVVLEVSDDGSGMSVETLSKIFDPFFTTKFTGRGLGLAAVLGIVRGHRGGLSVDSEVGRGTTFRLLFPAGGEASSEPIAPRAAAPAGASPGLVLVIDDEAPVREAVADILEIEGVQVVGAATGAAGIDLYRDRVAEIGLVLLDLSMPGMTGDETLRRLREINPDIQVVLSSGYSEAEATRRFTGLGLVGFIQKPYDAASLVEVVREHLA